MKCRISLRARPRGSVGLSGLWALAIACAAPNLSGCSSDTRTSDPNDDVYSVALSVPSQSGLPKCSTTISGTVAAVAKPPGLFSCQSSLWLPLPCTNLLAGAVAYSSTSKELWACASGQWTAVALPTGATGPAGSQGPVGPQGPMGAPGNGAPGPAGENSLISLSAEPTGPNCPAGGQRISAGLDINGNGVLDASEVQQTAYVCNAIENASDGGGSGLGAGGGVSSTGGGTAQGGSGASLVHFAVALPPAAGAASYTLTVDGSVFPYFGAGTTVLGIAGANAIVATAYDSAGQPIAMLSRTVNVSDGEVVDLTGAVWTAP